MGGSGARTKRSVVGRNKLNQGQPGYRGTSSGEKGGKGVFRKGKDGLGAANQRPAKKSQSSEGRPRGQAAMSKVCGGGERKHGVRKKKKKKAYSGKAAVTGTGKIEKEESNKKRGQEKGARTGGFWNEKMGKLLTGREDTSHLPKRGAGESTETKRERGQYQGGPI